MQCPKCGNRWSVKNTAPSSDPSRNHLRRRVQNLFNWYSQDYVVRVRSCSVCRYGAITVEFEVKDIEEIMRICSKEGMPKTYKKYKEVDT